MSQDTASFGGAAAGRICRRCTRSPFGLPPQLSGSAAPPTIAGRSSAGSALLPILITLMVAALGAAAVWLLWQTYMGKPWTRDGTVRANVVTLAPDVPGQVMQLAVKDNQFVHTGDLLMKIDPRDYKVAVDLSKAASIRPHADYENKKVQAARRLALSDLATSREERQTYVSDRRDGGGDRRTAKGQPRTGKHQSRTDGNSLASKRLGHQPAAPAGGLRHDGPDGPVARRCGFVLGGRLFRGNRAQAHSRRRRGENLAAWLRKVLNGHVDSVARGIVVSNAMPGKSGLATVNPIFTWVRLAQRIPVRVHIDNSRRMSASWSA